MAGRSSGRVVITEDRILEWGVELERGVEIALEGTVVEMTAKAKSVELPRQSGDLNASIHPLPIERSTRGFQTGVGAGDFKALWYEKGTKAHSNAKKSSLRLVSSKTGRGVRSAGGTGGFVSGVKGYHYLAGALYSTFPRFLARLRAAVG
jgi:hypothetical protein